MAHRRVTPLRTPTAIPALAHRSASPPPRADRHESCRCLPPPEVEGGASWAAMVANPATVLWTESEVGGRERSRDNQLFQQSKSALQLTMARLTQMRRVGCQPRQSGSTPVARPCGSPELMRLAIMGGMAGVAGNGAPSGHLGCRAQSCHCPGLDRNRMPWHPYPAVKMRRP